MPRQIINPPIALILALRRALCCRHSNSLSSRATDRRLATAGYFLSTGRPNFTDWRMQAFRSGLAPARSIKWR